MAINVKRAGAAVLYARYSSDIQNDRSIEDQFAQCELRKPSDVVIASRYCDRALSGASMDNRDGLQELLEAAARKEFDIVIVEAMNRLSRNMVEMPAIYKMLEFHEIGIYSLQDGWIGDVHVAIRSIEASGFSKQLGETVKRGATGSTKEGRSMGSVAYGYDLLRTNDRPTGGRCINADEARVIVRVFESYVSGVSAHAICGILNKEGVPSPTKGRWNAASLLGDKRFGRGLLRNRAFIGWVCYGRAETRRDPVTGKVIRIPTPPDTWVWGKAPHLRIMPDDLFEAVTERLAANKPSSLTGRKRPSYLLSSLIVCGECGRNYAKRNTKYVCSGRSVRACSNDVGIEMDSIHNAVMGLLHEELSRPELVEEFVREFRAHRIRISERGAARTAGLERDIVKNEKRTSKLLHSLGGDEEPNLSATAIRAEMNRVIGETRKLQAELRQARQALVPIPPAADLAKRLARQIGEIDTHLKSGSPVEQSAAREAIRRLIDRIVIPWPQPRSLPRDHVQFVVEGPVGALVGEESCRLLLPSSSKQLTAGERLFRLTGVVNPRKGGLIIRQTSKKARKPSPRWKGRLTV